MKTKIRFSIAIPGVVLRQVSDGFGYSLLQRKLYSYLNAVSLPNCGFQRCRNFIGQVHLPMNRIRTPGVPFEFSWVEDDNCMSEKVELVISDVWCPGSN